MKCSSYFFTIPYESEESIKAGNFIALCGSGSLQEVVDAIKNGANVNAWTSYEGTPLLVAVRTPNPDVVTALIKAGADVNARDNSYNDYLKGKTPLIMAMAVVSTSHRKEVMLMLTALIKAGADVNAKDNEGMTALMWAISTYHYSSEVEMVAALIKAGADVNAKSNDGATALILAAKKDIRRVIPILLESGADPKAKDNSGKMAVDYVRGQPGWDNSSEYKKLEEVSR